jgi:hypothetical protein
MRTGIRLTTHQFKEEAFFGHVKHLPLDRLWTLSSMSNREVLYAEVIELEK